jgi:hypothetical protein
MLSRSSLPDAQSVRRPGQSFGATGTFGSARPIGGSTATRRPAETRATATRPTETRPAETSLSTWPTGPTGTWVSLDEIGDEFFQFFGV